MCLSANRTLRVLRARFSALTQYDLSRALSVNLGQPNRLEADAVMARQEVDIRTGYAFTRHLTRLVQGSGLDVFADMGGGGGSTVVSWGPCQFPTLGFIVRRFWEARAAPVHAAAPPC